MAPHPGARRAPLRIAALAALSVSCGGGNGCAGTGALPADPAPWGFPMDEAIEGGMQARITPPGFARLSALIPALAQAVLPSMASPICMPEQQQSLKILGTGGDVRLCHGACAAQTGCPAWIDLRPDLAPPGGIGVSVPDGESPVVAVDAAFDVHMQVPIQHRLCLFGLCQGWQDDCTLDVDSPGTHIEAGVPLGIDPPTGKLTIALGDVNLVGLNLGFSNCGLLGDIFNVVTTVVNAVAGNFIGDTLLGLVKPPLAQAIAGLVPSPPGLAGRLDLATPLASFAPPPEAALEVLAVAGGYVSASGGGLNLGVIAGANSDRVPATRAPSPAAINSEPSPCVPARPTYALGAPPWRLATQPDRHDFLLDPAPAFTGMPDPLDDAGNVQDLALGISRTFLDEVGFHLYNSGALCLRVGEGVLGGQLNGGTLRLLAPSVGDLLTDPKAPVFLVLRPEEPLRFALGAGGKADPLLKISATDLRVDLYVFLEERYVRLLTLGLDVQLGLDLAVTVDAGGKPSLLPTLGTLSRSAVTVRVANTDLLAEKPTALASSLSALVLVAVAQLGGSLPAIALPSLMGFGLDGLKLSRVQTPADDFLALQGSFTQDARLMGRLMGTLAPLDGVPPRLPRPAPAALARLAEVSVPPAEVIRTAVAEGRIGDGDTPSVTLELGEPGDVGRLEWSYRLDGGLWGPFSPDRRPTLVDAGLLVQARHRLEVRARPRGGVASDAGPLAHLDFVVDALPPDLRFAVRPATRTVALLGRDNVSEDAALRYAWQTPAGFTAPSARAELGFDEIRAATAGGRGPLLVAVVDEQGNRTELPLDLASIPDLAPAPAAAIGPAGCGCHLGERHSGGGAGAAAMVLGLLALAVRRGRRGPRG